MRAARKRSRRDSDSAVISVPSTTIVPADGADTPAIRLSSVVLPEPLRPLSAVQRAAGTARCSTSSTSSGPPSPMGNDFLTPCSSTVAGASLMAAHRDTRAGPPLAPPAPDPALPDGDGIDRYADPTPQEQRADHEQKLVGL